MVNQPQITRNQIDVAMAKVDGLVDIEMTSSGVPGVAVAVVYDDDVVHAKGYGVREAGSTETVGTDTVFQLASLSKPISSTALAALVGKEVISWDDRVHPHAPDLAFSDPWITEHVTFADLYSHRSGLPASSGDWLEAIGYDRDQILYRLRHVPLNPFRITYAYTNFGMTAGGDAAAKAAGVSFEDLMDQQLFGPAGMTASSARYNDFLKRSDRATIHARIDGKWVPGPTRQPDAQAPAGGISASVNDVARWARVHLGNGTLEGNEIVKATALATTHTPHILQRMRALEQPGAYYGLGWNVQYDHLGFVRWSHSGAFSAGASTTVALLPAARLGVVVLTNAMPIGIAEAIADNILDTVVAGAPTQDWAKFWGELTSVMFLEDPSLARPPADPAPARNDSAYSGSYANDFFGTFEVTSGAGLTLMMGPAKLEYPLSHWDGDTFTYVSAPELPSTRSVLTFTVGGDGRASALDVNSIDGAGLGVLTRV